MEESEESYETDVDELEEDDNDDDELLDELLNESLELVFLEPIDDKSMDELDDDEPSSSCFARAIRTADKSSISEACWRSPIVFQFLFDMVWMRGRH
jgi:hypothetical protein